MSNRINEYNKTRVKHLSLPSFSLIKYVWICIQIQIRIQSAQGFQSHTSISSFSTRPSISLTSSLSQPFSKNVVFPFSSINRRLHNNNQRFVPVLYNALHNEANDEEMDLEPPLLATPLRPNIDLDFAMDNSAKHAMAVALDIDVKSEKMGKPITTASTGIAAIKKPMTKSKSSNKSKETKASTKKMKLEEEKNFDVYDPKKEALEGVLHQIERSYGRGSILKLGETNRMEVACTSTGSLNLDIALGGGYPKGRVVEIYGPESSGKTTLALHAIAEVQKEGGYCAFIDAEHALDPNYAKAIGVNTDQLLISQPDCGEMALDIVDKLVRSSAVDMVVIDSVAALVPRAELEGEMGDAQMGLQARLMSKALRKLTGSLAKSNCTILFLNQLRSKIGVFFGSPEVTAGGNALKYYATLRLDVRRKEMLKNDVGINVKVKVVKNKIAPPFRVVFGDILFGEGLDKIASLIDAAEATNILKRKGAWYRYNDINISQGKANLVQLLKTNPDMASELEVAVKNILREDGLQSSELVYEMDDLVEIEAEVTESEEDFLRYETPNMNMNVELNMPSSSPPPPAVMETVVINEVLENSKKANDIINKNVATPTPPTKREKIKESISPKQSQDGKNLHLKLPPSASSSTIPFTIEETSSTIATSKNTKENNSKTKGVRKSRKTSSISIDTPEGEGMMISQENKKETNIAKKEKKISTKIGKTKEK